MGIEQQDLGVCNHSAVLSAVTKLIEENEKWRGTATELAKVLGFDTNPRALVVRVNKVNGELENNGISLRHSISRGRRIISITSTHRITHNETTLCQPNKHTPKNTDFATPPEKEPITFPFSWQYGTIEELSKEEKIEVNALRRNGRKSYQKVCAICGIEGNLQYRKISDANSALLCKPCAESYIISAVKLINEGVGGDALEYHTP